MNQITASEMELINSYSRRELTPDDVYVFTVKLCDNDLDRDNERFTVESLFVLAKLFVGKTGITDHDPSANNQKMRIIACKVEYVEDKVTAVGEPYYRLMAQVYLLRNDRTQKLIENIEKGIIDEVSIGCSVRYSICSICHNDIHSPLCGHLKGEKYGVMGRVKLCFVELQEPTDAYEFAFVARPKNFLKPCTFCGGQAEIRKTIIPIKITLGTVVQCVDCGAQTRYVTDPDEEYVIRIWNRRVNNDLYHGNTD